MLLPREEWIFDVRKNVSSRGASDFRRKGLFLAPARRCMRQGKGKVFDEIVCLGWTPNITNKLFHVIFLFSRRDAAMDLLTTLVFLRWGSRVFFWDQWRRLKFFIFRFLKYLRIILLNYLKMYIYIFFLHMPFQFLGLLFIFRDISEISSKYERNTWAIWTSSKVLKKYRISSLSSFSYSCPFNFFRHFLLHLQDIVKMSHLNVTSKKNRIFWSIFLALSNSSLSYNFWNCIIFLLYNIFTNYPNIYKISKGFESFVTLLPRRNNSLDYPFSNLSDTFIFKIEEDFFKYSFLLFFFY